MLPVRQAVLPAAVLTPQAAQVRHQAIQATQEVVPTVAAASLAEVTQVAASLEVVHMAVVAVDNIM